MTYTITRKNGYTLCPATPAGARAAVNQLFRCHAKIVFVTTPEGVEYIVTMVKGKEQWYKRVITPVLSEDEMEEAMGKYSDDMDLPELDYACGGSEAM